MNQCLIGVLLWYEFNGDKGKKSSLNEYLEIIRAYVESLIDNLKESGQWKTQLSAFFFFRKSKDINEYPDMYLRSDNRELIIGIET